MDHAPGTESSAPPFVRAARHVPSHLRFWLTAILMLGLDLWSKHWAFSNLGPDEVRTVIPHALEFRRSLNDGAVFGSLTGHVELFIMASVLALAFVLFLFYGCSREQRALQIALGLVLSGTLGNLYDRTFMIADIVTYQSAAGREETRIGRLVSSPSDDTLRIGQWPEGTHVESFVRSAVELRRQGVVRDFIKIVPKFPVWVPRLGKFDMWPWIFNVADSALVCGVAVLLLSSWRERHPKTLAPVAAVAAES